MMLLFWIPLALVLFAGATSLSAQELRGRVLDDTSGETIGGAVLTLFGEDDTVLGATLSGRGGVFLLPATPKAAGRVRAQAFGYATRDTVITAKSGADATWLEIRLRPEPIPLEGITAAVSRRPNRNLEGFLRRQQNGFGRYLGPDRIAAMNPVLASQVLMPLSSRLVASGMGGALTAHIPPVALGRGSRMPYCVPRVYLDGTQLQGSALGVQVDAEVPARAIRAVEFYNNPHQAPSQFQVPAMGDCPVVVIWTDFGLDLRSSRDQP